MFRFGVFLFLALTAPCFGTGSVSVTPDVASVEPNPWLVQQLEALLQQTPMNFPSFRPSSQDSQSSTSHKLDPFREWLSQLKVGPVPGILINLTTALNSSVTGTVGINNLTCYDFTLNSLKSLYDKIDVRSLDVNVTGVGVTCTMDLNYSKIHYGIISLGSGTFKANASVNIDANLGLILNMTSGAYSLPQGIRTADWLSFKTAIPTLKLTFDSKAIGIGILEKLVDDLIQGLLPKELDPAVVGLIHTVVDEKLSPVLQLVEELLRPYIAPKPMPKPTSQAPGSINLNASWQMLLVNDVINEFLSPGSNFSINKIVDFFTDPPGSFNVSLTNKSIVVPIVGLANLTLGLKNIRLGGLDTWGALEILEVIGPNTAESHTNMTNLNIELDVSIDVVEDGGLVSGIPLFESFTLRMDLQNPSLKAVTEIALNQSMMHSLGMSVVADKHCFASTVMDLQTQKLEFFIQEEDVSVLPVHGSMEKDIDQALDSVVAFIFGSYGPAVPLLLNLEVANPLVNLLNDALTNATKNKSCVPGNETIDSLFPEASSMDPLLLYASTYGAFALVVVIACAVTAFGMQSSKHASSGAELYETLSPHSMSRASTPPPHDTNTSNSNATNHNTSASDGYYERLYPDLPGTTNVETDTGVYTTLTQQPQRISTTGDHVEAGHGRSAAQKKANTSPSLLHNPNISWMERNLVFAGILVCIPTFICANLLDGSDVFLTLQVDNTTVITPSVFSFSLGNTVTDMWKAHVYPLSLLIAIFSGFWPYTKVLLMAISWCTPPRWLSVGRRESLMMFLDALGKWSLMDSFLMTMFTVAFRFNIGTQIEGHAPGSQVPAVLGVEVAPQTGFFLFLFSTCFSLIMNHIILAYHRKAESATDAKKIGRRVSTISTSKESISSHAYKRGSLVHTFNGGGRIIVALLLSCTLLLIAAGVYVDSFSFKFGGLAGYALGDKSVRGESVISIATSLIDSSPATSVYLLWILSITFLGFVLVFPIAQIVMLLVLWLIPLNIGTQKQIFHAAEVFNAWASLDVFVLVLFAAILEISSIAEFMVGPYCNSINPILKKHFDKQLHGDDICFGVTTTLGNGCWILFCAALVQGLLASSILKLCNTAIHQRENSAMKNFHSSNVNNDDSDDEDDKPKYEVDCCSACFIRLMPFLMTTKNNDYLC
eukprot:m.109848 g.109848  ORF g.109848 m.109848 type:complete len:1167 (-) comp27992_c0_seq1:208-3708(-)